MGSFWHLPFQQKTFWCCNITMPKLHSAIMSPCWNVHGAKVSVCRNVPVPNVPMPERFKAKMSTSCNTHRDKMSVQKIYCVNNSKSRRTPSYHNHLEIISKSGYQTLVQYFNTSNSTIGSTLIYRVPKKTRG